ncbi:alpha-2-macroglobulin family protein [Chthonobacter rhizosphaerae]|uniref:alpha-2-macroglobulin family protein n=1 Tax=Chthonobacter rhizosphaerae TaxID=2735553 RepID=UPI001AED544D|nr:alpha-2-macroglobulin family protein [Chthonobacter rhizosphaerae]
MMSSIRFAARVAQALLVGLPLFASAAAAQERRAIVTENADYFGRDYQTLKGIDQSACEASCVADDQCRAFTYNVKARWCFLKAEFGDLKQTPGAVAGRIVAGAVPSPELEAERLADLSFLDQSLVDEARRQLGQINESDQEGSVDFLIARAENSVVNGNAQDALVAYGAALKLAPERFDLWDALSVTAQTLTNGDWQVRQSALETSLAASVNAYLRSVDDGQRVRALSLMTEALAAREIWKPAIKAARLGVSIGGDDELVARLDELVANHGFRVVENTVDSRSADPRLCIAFSEEIDKNAPNLADFVSVEGGDTTAVEAEDTQVCVTGVDYGKRYRIAVREGLPAKDADETLARTVEIEAYVRDRDPRVRFLGKAYVLPKGGDATIPVASVNVDEIVAEVVRIGDRALVQAIGEDTFLRQIGTWEASDIAARRGEQVWSGSILVKRELNREVTTAIPVSEVVKALEPGVYAMVATAKNQTDTWGEQATQWFIVTDLGLSSLSGNDGVHAVVRSLSSAGPVAGATLRLVALNDEILGTATTDVAGYARFDPGLARGTGGNAPALLVAETGEGDYAFLDLTKSAFDLTDRGVEGRAPPKPVDVFMTAERGVYRPGETVHVTTLARTAQALAAPDVPLTLIVTRPDGVEFSRTVAADEGAGGRDSLFPLPAGAMRGTWRVAAFTDPKAASLAEATFLVEDFQPERIGFELATDATVLEPGVDAEATLTAEWLYGAPAAGLGIEGEVYVTKAAGLPSAPGYRFGLASDTFEPVAEPVQAEATAEDGSATVALVTPELADTTVPLQAAVHVRVLDTNGRPVERKLTLPVSDGLARIGLDPQFEDQVEEGGSAAFNAIVLDADGNRVSATGLAWVLNKVETSFQWYNTGGSWGYNTVKSRTRVANGTLDVTADTHARIEERVTWGEYELTVEDPSGDAVPVSMTFEAGWYVAPTSEETPDILKVSLDKPRYAIGETVKARLEPRFPGVAVVTVVDDRLIAMKTVDVPEGGATVDLPVTSDWGPGAYVTATLLRPMDIEARRMPARALGLAWAGVDPGDRLLSVDVSLPEEQKPRTALPVEVTLANAKPGEPAYVTIAAVDLGILNLTRFAPPAPEDWYYGQRALGIEMRDLYGQLIDRMAGVRGEVRSGGDGTGLARLEGPPPTEQLVSFFQGVTQVDADGKARASFPLPDFNGTVRVMAIAWSGDAVGHGFKDVVVRDPVVVQAALPNFLAPGDRSRLKLDFTHLEGPSGAFDLSVAVAGDLVTLDPALGSRTLTLADKGRAEVLIPIEAVAVGDETVSVALTTPAGEVLTKTLTVPVRANEPPVVRVSDLTLPAGSGRLDIAPDLFADLVPGTAQATVTVGGVSGIDLPGLVSSLDKYPYGCSEQITSRALPLVYLDDVVLAAGLAGETPVRDRVAKAVEQVLVNQASNGSFGLWGPSADDLWLDAYVTDFLTRAKEKGIPVPAIPFDLAVTNLKNRVSYTSEVTEGGEDLAYALYVLARNGRATIGDLRYYAETKLQAFATPLAKAQLGAALALYGDTERAGAVFQAATGDLAQRLDHKGWRKDYGSDLRDGAAILTLASETRVPSVDLATLGREVGALARASTARSTQEQAWMLLAANALLNDGVKPVVEVNGTRREGVLTAHYTAEDLATGPVAIRNVAEAPVDARVTVTGVPVTPEPAGGTGYAITRKAYDLDGNEIDISALELGARVVVVLTVTTTESVAARLVVDDPLPAGLAIDNPSLLAGGDVAALGWVPLVSQAARTEFRADRFVAALDQPAGGATEFALAYMARAVAPGAFTHPAATVTDMYRPERNARTDAGDVEVIGPLQ